jgi:hypothetical protein
VEIQIVLDTPDHLTGSCNGVPVGSGTSGGFANDYLVVLVPTSVDAELLCTLAFEDGPRNVAFQLEPGGFTRGVAAQCVPLGTDEKCPNSASWVRFDAEGDALYRSEWVVFGPTSLDELRSASVAA